MRHIVFNLIDCDQNLIDDEEYIRVSLEQSAEICGATLISTSSHKFTPQGVTAIALLSESHISIHTWPEKKLAVCDVFTCGTTAKPMKAVIHMVKKFDATDCILEEVNRNHE
jgi:S-adenosylmethionine decarboxylase